MAYSKVLLGDLPELIKEIIQYFLHDYKALYSCILVNRLWCRLAIPLLWEDPFSFPNSTKNYHFIEVYLYNLNDGDKLKLNEYGINSNLFPSNTLFNYPNFIKYISTHNISRSIIHWGTIKKMKNENFTLLIFKLLLKLFIENGASLCIFSNIRGGGYRNITFDLISQNPNFICNIKNLKIISNLNTNYLEFLYSNSDSVSFLDIHFSFNINNVKYLSQLINSQRNLKKIKLCYANVDNLLLLKSLKNSNCSNTLNTIIFYRVSFKNIVTTNFKEIFEQLNVLKSIHILNCYFLDSAFIQDIINITNPFKLETLFLYESLKIDLLQLLLQKFGYCLKNVGLRSYHKSKCALITKYCTNIKILDLIGSSCQMALDFIDLIQNLNHLSITTIDTTLSSDLLLNLGQILPIKMDYLHMDFNINKSDFEIFLMNSQNTFIKKLLIRSKDQIGYEYILPFIKEYIMKKKRVKYLAVTAGMSLKDKEKEFELHDIIVLNYNELKVNHLNFRNIIY
jgi:hypothetical protein